MTPRKQHRGLSGELFSGFTNVEEIGSGGFSTVFGAIEETTNRPVALKLLDVRHLSEHTVDSFRKEITALGALSTHPNIVTLYRATELDDGRPVLVMERCQGTAADLAGQGLLPPERAVGMAIKILGALETAHRADMLHQDVKPRNILITGYGEPALADFGMARLHSSADATSAVFGFTTLHAAPELLEGSKASPATDVYEMGSTLYHLLAGRAAFRTMDGEAPAAVILRILRDPVRPLNISGVSTVLSDAVLSAMSKDPTDRPQTALGFAQILQDVERRQGWEPTPYAVIGEPRIAPGRPTPDPGPALRPSISSPAGTPRPGAGLFEVGAPDDPDPYVPPPTGRVCREGHPSEGDGDFCEQCGNPLIGTDPAPAPPHVPPPSRSEQTNRPPSTGGAMNIADSIGPSVAYGPGLTAPEPQEVDPVTDLRHRGVELDGGGTVDRPDRHLCPGGHVVPDDDIFCGECGLPVGGPASGQPLPIPAVPPGKVEPSLALADPAAPEDLPDPAPVPPPQPPREPMPVPSLVSDVAVVPGPVARPKGDPADADTSVTSDPAGKPEDPETEQRAVRPPELAEPVMARERTTVTPMPTPGGPKSAGPAGWVPPSTEELLKPTNRRGTTRGPRYVDPEPVIYQREDSGGVVPAPTAPESQSPPGREPEPHPGPEPQGLPVVDGQSEPIGFGFPSPEPGPAHDPLDDTTVRPGSEKPPWPPVNAEPATLSGLFKPLRKRPRPKTG